MQFWSVHFSYRVKPADRRPYRENSSVGVVATSIEDAIALAKSTVDADSEPKVWSVSHRGPVDIVQPADTPTPPDTPSGGG